MEPGPTRSAPAVPGACCASPWAAGSCTRAWSTIRVRARGRSWTGRCARWRRSAAIHFEQDAERPGGGGHRVVGIHGSTGAPGKALCSRRCTHGPGGSESWRHWLRHPVHGACFRHESRAPSGSHVHTLGCDTGGQAPVHLVSAHVPGTRRFGGLSKPVCASRTVRTHGGRASRSTGCNRRRRGYSPWTRNVPAHQGSRRGSVASCIHASTGS